MKGRKHDPVLAATSKDADLARTEATTRVLEDVWQARIRLGDSPQPIRVMAPQSVRQRFVEIAASAIRTVEELDAAAEANAGKERRS